MNVESTMARGFMKRCVLCSYVWGTPLPVEGIKRCPILRPDGIPCPSTKFECVPILIPTVFSAASS